VRIPRNRPINRVVSGRHSWLLRQAALATLSLSLASCGLGGGPETYNVKIFPIDFNGCWIGRINGEEVDACGNLARVVVVDEGQRLEVTAMKNPFGDFGWRLVLQIYKQDGQLCSSDYTVDYGGSVTAACTNS